MTAPDDLVRQARNAAIDTMPTRKLAEDTLYWLMADEIVRLRERVAELEAENARLQNDTAEIDRLRGENARLRDELALMGHPPAQIQKLERRAERAEASEAEARAKIAEQMIEIGQLQDRLENYFKRLTRMDGLLANVEAERDALRADAERYRWLRSYRPVSILSNLQMQPMPVGRPSWEHIDAAIDAARGSHDNHHSHL